VTARSENREDLRLIIVAENGCHSVTFMMTSATKNHDGHFRSDSINRLERREPACVGQVHIENDQIEFGFTQRLHTVVGAIYMLNLVRHVQPAF
jgi:hypothetical protein